MTGLSLLAPDLGGKRMELLKETVPKVSRVAGLWNPANAVKALELKSTEVAARALGVLVTSIEVRAPTDFDRAFAAIARERPNAVGQRERIRKGDESACRSGGSPLRAGSR